MSWRGLPPVRSDYDTKEEYQKAFDAYLDALYDYYDDRRED